jgi:hypothetical protein
MRRLCPSPDIALERISQTALGLPASRPVEASGSNQQGAVPLTPRRSCKNQSLVRKLPCAYLAYDTKILRQKNTCICCIIVCTKCAKVFTSLHRVCNKSAQLPSAYLTYENKKSAPNAHFYASMHDICIMSAHVCIKYASGVQFYQQKYFPRKNFC